MKSLLCSRKPHSSTIDLHVEELEDRCTPAGLVPSASEGFGMELAINDNGAGSTEFDKIPAPHWFISENTNSTESMAVGNLNDDYGTILAKSNPDLPPGEFYTEDYQITFEMSGSGLYDDPCVDWPGPEPCEEDPYSYSSTLQGGSITDVNTPVLGAPITYEIRPSSPYGDRVGDPVTVDISATLTVSSFGTTGGTLNASVVYSFQETPTVLLNGAYAVADFSDGSSSTFEAVIGDEFTLTMFSSAAFPALSDGVAGLITLDVLIQTHFELKPDLEASLFRYNEDRAMQGKELMRGVDFGYLLRVADLPVNTQWAFYWANGPTWESRIGGPLLANDKVDATQVNPRDLISAAVGTYGPYNEDSREWGGPARGTTHILFVLDPNNVIDELDEDNNVLALELHSTKEIFANSITWSLTAFPNTGPGIQFEFVPGSGIGETLTLSEAEIALGVDHFNWINEMSVPDYWQAQAWKDIFDPTSWDPLTHSSGWYFYPFQLPTFIFLDGPNVGWPIEREALPQASLYDPIVQTDPNEIVSHVYRIENSDVAAAGFFRTIMNPVSDAGPYYFNERDDDYGTDDQWINFTVAGGTKNASEFVFRDNPTIAHQLPNGIKAYQQPSGHRAFVTRLVGVHAVSANSMRRARLPEHCRCSGAGTITMLGMELNCVSRRGLV